MKFNQNCRVNVKLMFSFRNILQIINMLQDNSLPHNINLLTDMLKAEAGEEEGEMVGVDQRLKR